MRCHSLHWGCFNQCDLTLALGRLTTFYHFNFSLCLKRDAKGPWLAFYVTYLTLPYGLLLAIDKCILVQPIQGEENSAEA